MKVVNPTNQSDSEQAAKPRAKSAIGYPYFDLESSIAVAKVIRERGGMSCEADQLAHWLDYKSTRSGTYLTRVAAAKQFGLISGNSDRFSVTDRALAIIAPVMPSDAARAKSDAFLAVGLFARVFNDFRGKMLPPAVGIANLFQNTYGIVPDRVPQAVRVFLSSAQQADYLAGSGDTQRLVPPATAATAAQPDEKPDASAPESLSTTTPAPEKPKGGSSGGGDGPTGIHTAIIGLLRDLPPPGTVWPTKAKARFMAAFKANIDHIYPEEDET